MEVSPCYSKPTGRASITVTAIITLIIPLLHWAVFWLYVKIDGIGMAFQDQRTGEWTLSNFVQVWEALTAPDGELKIAFRNTLLYFIESNVLLVLNLLVSFFIYKKIAGWKTYRIIFFPSN